MAIAVLAVALVSACSGPGATPSAPSPSPSAALDPTPTPSLGPLASPLPASELADAPPSDVEAWIGTTLHAGFRPLTSSELALVRVTSADARKEGLAQPPGGYGSNGGRIAWTKVGCIYLGYFTGPPMPTAGYVPPEVPAYVVQVIGQPVPDFPDLNIQAAVIDAQTGKALTMYSTTGEPVLGTTCGVSP